MLWSPGEYANYTRWRNRRLCCFRCRFAHVSKDDLLARDTGLYERIGNDFISQVLMNNDEITVNFHNEGHRNEMLTFDFAYTNYRKKIPVKTRGEIEMCI